jgi:hypothetical protein
MRVNTIKSAFASILLVFSVVCFIYVNTATVTEPTTAQTNLELNKVAAKDTRMPDLKLVKSVVGLISKFMTAK